MTNVLIRMKDETLRQTDRLQKKLGSPSRSDVIRRAIDLSEPQLWVLNIKNQKVM